MAEHAVTSAARGLPIDIPQLLAARDERAARQQDWLHTYSGALLSFCINMPGPVKDNTEARQLQQIGIEAVQQLLGEHSWTCLAHEAWQPATGPETFWSVACDPLALKQATIALEQRHPLGRLFDLDVLQADGTPLSRSHYHLPPRRCFICDDLAAVCGRSRRHSFDELVQHIRNCLTRYHEDHSCTP